MSATGKGEPAQPTGWRQRSAAARVIVIFTDASFKEPLAKPKGATFEDVYHQLISNRIILSIFAPQIPCYEKLSEVDCAEWHVVTGGANPQESMATFTADQENFSQTLRQLAKTIGKTAEALPVD
jgi:hypothetical protein